MRHNTVLFVDHAEEMGGAEFSLLSLMKGLRKDSDWVPHLATGNGRFLQQAQQQNIPTHAVTLPRLRRSPKFITDWLHGGNAIASIAKAANAQILHGNTVRASLYTAVAAQKARLPFIWHMRDFWLSENEPQKKWLDKLGKWMLSQVATKIIANSRVTAKHLPDIAKVAVVYNGIDLAELDFKEDGRLFCQPHNIPFTQPVIGMMGRLRPWKGQKTFLQVAAQISQACPQAHFLIVGGNPFTLQDSYADELKQLAQELQLTDRITFTGQIADVQSALAAMDIFVHPGDPEPFGLVNIEAMAMAKPVVAFAHGALPEIVVEGETGLLIPPYNIAAMANGIITLLDNPIKSRQLGENGLKRVETHFTVRQTTKQIVNIYQQILEKK